MQCFFVFLSECYKRSYFIIQHIKYIKQCKLQYISCTEPTFKLLEQAVQYACSSYKTARDITPYESALL